MNKATRVIAAGMGSALAMAGAVQAVAVADEAQGNAVQPVAIEASVDAREIAGDRVVVPEVVGTFGFTQTEVSSNEWIARHIGEASRYLCGSAVVQVEDGVDAADWVLEVTGDVAHPYATTIADLAATNEVQASLLGCACAANPTDGLAIANAMVEGISVNDILRIARPADGANTVVFVSADGYEVALPLAYLSGRACPWCLTSTARRSSSRWEVPTSYGWDRLRPAILPAMWCLSASRRAMPCLPTPGAMRPGLPMRRCPTSA